MVSWLVSIEFGYTSTQKDDIPSTPPEPMLSHTASRTHYPTQGLVSKAVVGQTGVTW